MNNHPKLTVELVPLTSWFENIRSRASQAKWDRLRRATYRKANYTCEICGGRGDEWPVECHEIWHYDDDQHIQKLAGLIALCPTCHEVKHIGLARLKGRRNQAKAHLVKVNGWTPKQADEYLAAVTAKWRERCRYKWKLDLTWLEKQEATDE